MLTGTPFIPETITVHLGTPDSGAANVTVNFPDMAGKLTSCQYLCYNYLCP